MPSALDAEIRSARGCAWVIIVVMLILLAIGVVGALL